MPTILRIANFRFHFYSNEGNEPPHFHARCPDGECKFWPEPVVLASNRGIAPHDLREIERLLFENNQPYWITIMDTSVYKTEPVALKAWTEKRMIYLELTDGRIVGFPADRFRILSQASEKQLKAVQIEVGGYALRWEELDEDLTVSGIINGQFQLPLPRQVA